METDLVESLRVLVGAENNVVVGDDAGDVVALERER